MVASAANWLAQSLCLVRRGSILLETWPWRVLLGMKSASASSNWRSSHRAQYCGIETKLHRNCVQVQ